MNGLLITRLKLHREDNEKKKTILREARCVSSQKRKLVHTFGIRFAIVEWFGRAGSRSENNRSVDKPCEKNEFPNMPPTTPTDPAMCSLCPRSKKAHHPKKLVRFDSIVDTFSISDSNAATNERVRPTIFYLSFYSRNFQRRCIIPL